MRDALILLLSCFLCYPKLLAQQPSASVKNTVGNSMMSAPWNRAGRKTAVRTLAPPPTTAGGRGLVLRPGTQPRPHGEGLPARADNPKYREGFGQ
jgi:hypothetical protein